MLQPNKVHKAVKKWAGLHTLKDIKAAALALILERLEIRTIAILAGGFVVCVVALIILDPEV